MRHQKEREESRAKERQLIIKELGDTAVHKKLMGKQQNSDLMSGKTVTNTTTGK